MSEFMEEGNDYGACCCCGVADNTVRNLVEVNRRDPFLGSGRGCWIYGLPCDGALAVVCDDCFEDDDLNITEAIYGHATDKQRIAISKLEPFEHDPELHKEGEEEGYINE